jgi:hypothetical protein
MAADHINFDALPLNTPKGAQYTALVARVRADLARDGCAVVKNTLTAAGLDALTTEAENASASAHKSYNRTNPYFTQDDPSLPEAHPKRRFFDRSNAFIPADNFQKFGPLRQIHDHPGFDGFIQTCLQETQFYRYADPLADVIVNMADQGPGFPWHFDTNNFTVTLAIQNAETGGAFEYVPNIRSGGENFDQVTRVLDGTSDRVKVLELEPGDLQIFKGRYSLHRVAPLGGGRPRFVAIFSYVEEPNMVGTPERCKQLYGKVLPVHFERAGMRIDTYLD